MDLLLETNFLLELVYQQEQVLACEAILQAAEAGQLVIHLPAFSLAEQLYQFIGESKKRFDVQSTVQQAILQAARETSERSHLVRLERELSTVLEARSQQQQMRLLELGRRVTQIAQGIPLSVGVWTRTTQLVEEAALTLPDCVVCASLLERAAELGTEKPKLFITRDRKGFQQPFVRQLFQEQSCEVLLNFEHAAQRLRLT